jgi:phosphate transport system substrate-binding protein
MRRRAWAGLLLLLLPLWTTAAPRLVSTGSDTLGELMLAWAQVYAREPQGLQLQVTTPGSAAAAPALALGSADLGPMSRPMNAAETSAYRARRGTAPGNIRIAFDAIAVVVHPDNPLQTLQLADLARIWGTDGACGAAAGPQRWGELQPASPLAALPLLRLGRNTASGTYEFFHHAALCDGAGRADVVQFAGAGAIIAATAGQRNAIGYASLSHVNGLVRVLALRDGAEALAPDAASVISGRYPLSRPLYLYFNRAVDGRPEPRTAAFLRFALSPAGQAVVARQGFIPLPAAELRKELEQLP